jgi:hypothetical protein
MLKSIVACLLNDSCVLYKNDYARYYIPTAA